MAKWQQLGGYCIKIMIMCLEWGFASTHFCACWSINKQFLFSWVEVHRYVHAESTCWETIRWSAALMGFFFNPVTTDSLCIKVPETALTLSQTTRNHLCLSFICPLSHKHTHTHVYSATAYTQEGVSEFAAKWQRIYRRVVRTWRPKCACDRVCVRERKKKKRSDTCLWVPY